ncbi:MAG: hypothetical protein NTY08_18185, partial [Proteobacteria bacterium]|nr:hypothetical protein [Pseudomonadota bacterium]
RIFNSNASNTNGWWLGTGGGTVPSSSFSIADNTTYRMTFNSSGNVGIGTTAPGAKLDVDNSAAASTAAISLNSQTGQNSQLLMKINGTLKSAFTSVASDTSLRINHNGSDRLTIDANGNVGIGTANPRAGLEIANGSLLLKNSINNGSATTIDFALGNIQYTTGSCGALTLNNMADSGSYLLVIKGATSATCSFTIPGLTAHMPVDHGATIANKHTMYNFIVVGADAYISWASGI